MGGGADVGFRCWRRRQSRIRLANRRGRDSSKKDEDVDQMAHIRLGLGFTLWSVGFVSLDLGEISRQGTGGKHRKSCSHAWFAEKVRTNQLFPLPAPLPPLQDQQRPHDRKKEQRPSVRRLCVRGRSQYTEVQSLAIQQRNAGCNSSRVLSSSPSSFNLLQQMPKKYLLHPCRSRSRP